MTHSPAQVLAAYLKAETGSPFTDPLDKLDWPVFVSSMPDGASIPKVAAVYDTQGRLLNRDVTTGEEEWAFGIQVKVRTLDYGVAFQKSEEVADLLSALHNASVTIEESAYNIEVFNMTSRSLSLGLDEQRRSQFTTNGLVMLWQTA